MLEIFLETLTKFTIIMDGASHELITIVVSEHADLN